MSSAIFTSPHSSSAPTSMETLVAMLGHVARFEARLEAQEQRLAMANTTPRPEPEPDPLFGRPLTLWDLPRPRIALEMCSNRSDWNPSIPREQPAYSESYGGGGWYSYNNYESQAWSYNNYESQARSYNTSEPDRYINYESQVQYELQPPAQYYTYESNRYNYVSQTVQYEPPPSVHYYSVAELPPQLQHYYPSPPSYTQAPNIATLETDVNDSEARVDARQDEIAGDPLLEEISEDESTPMVDTKLIGGD